MLSLVITPPKRSQQVSRVFPEVGRVDGMPSGGVPGKARDPEESMGELCTPPHVVHGSNN